MGSWGPGNFQQDYALDFIWREVQQPLLRQLEALVKDPELGEADEPTSGTIMASVEILSILCEHANAAPPSPDVVARWKELYLDSWNSTADEVYVRKQDVIDRRSVITATFDRLIVCAKKFHSANA